MENKKKGPLGIEELAKSAKQAHDFIENKSEDMIELFKHRAKKEAQPFVTNQKLNELIDKMSFNIGLQKGVLSLQNKL